MQYTQVFNKLTVLQEAGVRHLAVDTGSRMDTFNRLNGDMSPQMELPAWLELPALLPLLKPPVTAIPHAEAAAIFYCLQPLLLLT